MHVADHKINMDDDSRAEQEMMRLQEMHDTVERLRSQLKTIKLTDPGGGDDRGGSALAMHDNDLPHGD